MSAPAGQRALTGEGGYKRLVRLLARAFYAGECPPKEAEPEDVPAGASRWARKDKNEYIGLGVLLLDLLVAAHGYVKDVSIMTQLGVSGKVANRALRYLQAEGLLASEVTKTKVKRQNVEQPDDPELEARMSQMTNTWWCVAYPSLLDSLRLRLHRMREMLKKRMGNGDDVLEYLCRRCGATYTSLDAVRLIDPASGAFRCEECQAELDTSSDAVAAGLGAGGAASRQQLQQYAKRMLEKLEQQLRPLIDQLDKVKDVPPPDFGGLRDWHQQQHELQRRRLEQAARARQKMAGRGLAQDHLDDDQVLDWLAQAEVQVDLGAAGAAAAAAAGPGKEVPLWFRGADSESVGGAASQEVPGSEAEQQQQQQGGDAEEEQQRLQEAFLAQYLTQVQAAARQVQEDGKDDLVVPDAKRMKTENGHAGVKPEHQLEERAGALLWEDVKEEEEIKGEGGAQLEQQQQQQQQLEGGIMRSDAMSWQQQQQLQQQQQPLQQEQPPDDSGAEQEEEMWEDI